MTSKIKQEVNNARTRLDATLQSLVDKTEDSLDSTLKTTKRNTEESDDEHYLPVPIGLDVVRNSPVNSPISSPSKRIHGQHKNKKRKRKADPSYNQDTSAQYQHNTTYVMKLFDRSVDLAQFDQTTPLYPIARAWINNQTVPELDSTSQEGDTTGDEDETKKQVHKMPLPIRLKIEYDAAQKDPRIPPPLPNTEQPLDIHANPDHGPPPEELLIRHMNRWKKVRKTWINSARLNELKYNNSMVILKDMYERNLQEQSYDT